MPKMKLSLLSLADLTKELARREQNKIKMQKKLEKRRAKLLRQLTAIDAELGTKSAPPAARKGKPGRKPGTQGRKAKAKAKPGPKPKAAKKVPAVRKARTGKRAKNSMTLPAAMASVMSPDKAMGVKEIAAAVAAAGYKSKSKTFETIIYQALKKNKGFAKASRGQYVLAA